MPFLIDSDVLIDVIDGEPNAISFFEELLGKEECVVSAVTVAELYSGVSPTRFPERAQARIDLFFTSSEFDVLPLDPVAGKLAGHLYGSLKAVGLTTGLVDLMNAAIALVHGYTIVTRNVRHYRRIPDLNIAVPSKA